MNHNGSGFFDLTKKELNGITLLSVLILLCIFLPYVADYYRPEPVYDLSRLKEQAAILDEVANNTYTENLPGKISRPAIPVKLFSFDPNTINEMQWQQLGISARQARTIRNYLAKGGRFRQREDLQKIYSLRPEDYNRLEPYIRIADAKPKTDASFAGGFSAKKETAAPVVVEINAADSAKLTEIRGIGPAFASRIIKYRNRLGGFIDKNQLMEVFGLDAEKYTAIEAQVRVDAGLRQMIDINAVDFENLRRNPYLSYKQVNAIIQFRRQHGPYKSIDDMREIAILDDEILRKIEPYLAFR
ncbi:MAG: helix-hairpin-helix domain-containing protein [Mucilaginibacter polytrichastri]|nr:helix-hairpin-helix domain-containing protein [Mucilaginibacter polytrichastri]